MVRVWGVVCVQLFCVAAAHGHEARLRFAEQLSQASRHDASDKAQTAAEVLSHSEQLFPELEGIRERDAVGAAAAVAEEGDNRDVPHAAPLRFKHRVPESSSGNQPQALQPGAEDGAATAAAGDSGVDAEAPADAKSVGNPQHSKPGELRPTLANAAAASDCKPGSHVTTRPGSDALACELCDTGTYSSAAGASECTQCPSGTFTSRVGSTQCDSCPSGHECPSKGTTTPKVCDAETYADSGSNSCDKCSMLFQINDQQDGCEPSDVFYICIAVMALLALACIAFGVAALISAREDAYFKYYDKNVPGAPFHGTV